MFSLLDNKETPKTYTKEEFQKEVQKAVEEQNFQEIFHKYALSVDKMARDFGVEKDKSKILNMDAETVKMYLESPDKYIKQLIDLSLAMFISVPQYQNLIKYFSDMALITPYILPVKVNSAKSKLKKEYSDCSFLLEKMNVEMEFRKAIASTVRDGAFYGFEIENDNSYTIKQLNPKYCRVIGSNDGCWIYEFDFSFFNGKKIKDTNQSLLDSYPPEFAQMYKKYKIDSKLRWQVVDMSKQVCLRYFSELNSPCIDFPPYCNLFSDLIDIMDYKSLNKVKTEMENYRFIALIMQTSTKDDGMNKFTVDPALVGQYYDFLTSVCGNTITPFISPVPVQELKFSSKATDINQVANAEKSAWNASGVSDSMFGNGAKNAGTLKFSTIVDQNKLNDLYNQIETILTSKMKRNFSNVFRIKIPKVNSFNKNEYASELLKDAQYGVPILNELFATLGLTPCQAEGALMLEDMYDFIGRMIPLQSSHTQDSSQVDEEGGRPKLDDEDLDVAGEQTRNDDSNGNKV